MTYGGIYMGVCTNISDPEGLLRIKVEVPAVYGKGNESDWAWPCFPPGWPEPLAAAAQHSFTDNADVNSIETLTHAAQTAVKPVPPVGEPVWVMFVAGDPDHPVWMGQWRKTGG